MSTLAQISANSQDGGSTLHQSGHDGFLGDLHGAVYQMDEQAASDVHIVNPDQLHDRSRVRTRNSAQSFSWVHCLSWRNGTVPLLAGECFLLSLPSFETRFVSGSLVVENKYCYATSLYFGYQVVWRSSKGWQRSDDIPWKN